MKLIFILILILIVFCIFYIIQNKVIIKWKTLNKKSFKSNSGKFGIYCVCGKQGSGKTLTCLGYLVDNINGSNLPMYCNMKSISDTINYTYIKDLKDMLKLRDKTDILIFFDEIFTEISKLFKEDKQLAKDILDFLSQMRKRRILLYTTCQEWRLLPLYFRLYVRYQVKCKMFYIPFFGSIQIKTIVDGDDIHWDELEQDFVGETINTIIEKAQLSIANLYDTFETIGSYSNYTSESISKYSQEVLINDKELENTIKDSLESNTFQDRKNQIMEDFWGKELYEDLVNEETE